MTAFAEAPAWWTDLKPGIHQPRDFVTAVGRFLDNHIDGSVSTRDLAELLWPECNVRGDAQVKARQRMYKVLMRLARTTLKDYCEQSGELNKFGGIPYRWHKARVIENHFTAARREVAVHLAAVKVLAEWDRYEDRTSPDLPDAIDALREAVK